MEKKEKVQIGIVLKCNKVLYKILQQQSSFSFSTGFKIYQIIKKFNSVEEFVISTMDSLFGGCDFNSLSEEQKTIYSSIISSEIEVTYEKIPLEVFKNNDKLMLTIEDLKDLEIILELNSSNL